MPAEAAPEQTVVVSESAQAAPELSLAELFGDEVVSGKPTETEAEPQDKAPEEAPADDETPPARAADPDALFTDESLATPEGLKAARAEVEARLKKWRQDFARTKKIEDKTQRRRLELKKEREAFDLERSTHRDAVSNLTRGGAKDTFAALSRIIGRDPAKFYEELSLHMATDGKPPQRPDTPESRELAELRERIEARDREEHTRETQAAIDRHRQAIAQHIVGSPDTYPGIAAYVGDDRSAAVEVVDWIQERIVQAHQNGRRLPAAEAAAMLESSLKRLAGRSTGAAEQQKSEAQGAPAKKPAETPRTPARRETVSSDLEILRAAGLPI